MTVYDPAAANVDKGALRQLYQSNVAARAVLDHFAARERNWGEVTVDRLARNIWTEGSAASRADVIGVLKALEEAGCGKFVVGRGGHPSRFRWYVGMVAVGRHASGEPAVIEQVSPEAPSEEEAEPSDTRPATPLGSGTPEFTHTFQLRPELAISLRLPADLTDNEASRLAEFVKSLPF